MDEKVFGPADLAAAVRELQRNPPQLPGHTAEEVGQLLVEFLPYLLTIATDELPRSLAGKIGASDLVHETIMRGLEHSNTFAGTSREELARWLRTILLNVLANTVKSFQTEKRKISRERGIHAQHLQNTDPSPSSEALSREQWDLLQAALARLSDDHREVVLLRHRDNLTFLEIGLHIGKSEEATRKVWSRAIERLRKELGSHDARPH